MHHNWINTLIVFLFAAGHAGSYCGVYLCGGYWFGYYCSFNNHIKEDKLWAKVRSHDKTCYIYLKPQLIFLIQDSLAEVRFSIGQILPPVGHLLIAFRLCNSKMMICVLAMRTAPTAN